jgi:hypothetical protein
MINNLNYDYLHKYFQAAIQIHYPHSLSLNLQEIYLLLSLSFGFEQDSILLLIKMLRRQNIK